jgi:hypothetical protein
MIWNHTSRVILYEPQPRGMPHEVFLQVSLELRVCASRRPMHSKVPRSVYPQARGTTSRFEVGTSMCHRVFPHSPLWEKANDPQSPKERCPTGGYADTDIFGERSRIWVLLVFLQWAYRIVLTTCRRLLEGA